VWSENRQRRGFEERKSAPERDSMERKPTAERVRVTKIGDIGDREGLER